MSVLLETSLMMRISVRREVCNRVFLLLLQGVSIIISSMMEKENEEPWKQLAEKEVRYVQKYEYAEEKNRSLYLHFFKLHIL